MSVLSQLLHYKIVVIIRGAQPGDVLSIANALYSGGIRAVEITLNSIDALAVIRELSIGLKEKMLVGAGTVLDAASAAKAIEAGAEFIISPSLDVETIRLTKEMGRVSIPGAFTATEIVTAYKAGGDLIKVFPVSNPQYIRDLKGPLDHIPLMPTGGVSLQNISEFQKAGALAFGIGSSLVDTKRQVSTEYLNELAQKASQFFHAITYS